MLSARVADKKNVRNCAPVTDFITKINNTQVGNAKDLNVAMQMNNLIGYNFHH